MENPFATRNVAKPLQDTSARPHTVSVRLPDEILNNVFSANDEKSALRAAQEIAHIDTARRIHAYVDIYSTFEDAMTEESREEFKETVVIDLLQFSGERLPADAARVAGVPDDFIKYSKRTGIIDYADIQASFRVWDEIERGSTMEALINAFIDQFGALSAGNAHQAMLLKEAFSLSVTNSTKVASNERDLLRQLQSTGSPNRFNDEEAQKEALRIAAERDRARQIGREALAN